jgi:hypothetical protein
MNIGIPLTGVRFGRLIAIRRVNRKKTNRPSWWCICDCRKRVIVDRSGLVTGRTTSCGCYRRELQRKLKTIHGHTPRNIAPSPEYHSWVSMKQRCFNADGKNYNNYGGRGITVCERWTSSFENFLKDMGSKPSSDHSLDRMNVNGNYEPSNCKWATKKEQKDNQRSFCGACGREKLCPHCLY